MRTLASGHIFDDYHAASGQQRQKRGYSGTKPPHDQNCSDTHAGADVVSDLGGMAGRLHLRHEGNILSHPKHHEGVKRQENQQKNPAEEPTALTLAANDSGHSRSPLPSIQKPVIQPYPLTGASRSPHSRLAIRPRATAHFYQPTQYGTTAMREPGGKESLRSAERECLKAALPLLEDIAKSNGRLSQAQQRQAAALAEVIRKLSDTQQSEAA